METNTNTETETKTTAIYKKTPTLALIIRSHGNIPLTYKPNAKLEEIVRLIDYKNQYNIEKIDEISLSHLGGVCYGDSHIGELMKEVNKHQYADTADKINKTFFNIDEKLQPAVHKIFGNSFHPEIKNNINLAIEKYYTKYDQNSGVFIFAHDNLSPFQYAAIQQSLTGINKYLLEENKNNIIKKTDILNDIKSAFSPNNKVNLIIIDLTCSAYFDENNFPLTEDIVNWINNTLQHNNIRGGVNTKKSKKSKKSKRYKKSKKNRKTKKKNIN